MQYTKIKTILKLALITVILSGTVLLFIYNNQKNDVFMHMEELCNKDGGITVFEQASTENEHLDRWGLPVIDTEYIFDKHINTNEFSNYKLVRHPQKIIFSKKLLFGSREINLYRGYQQLFRKLDSQIIAVGIAYRLEINGFLRPYASSEDDYWWCEKTGSRPTTSHSDIRSYVFIK